MFGGTKSEQERATGIVAAAVLRPNELLRNAEAAVAGQAYLEWARYDAAAQMHRQLVEPHEDTAVALRALDPFAVCAARLAAAQQITQQGAEHHLSRALALRDRLPAVNEQLRQGRVAAHHIATIVSRTDLIDGSAFMAGIDHEIAGHLQRPGSWSKNRMRDMVDATIFRRDPDLVRQDREDAKNKRGVWSNNIEHGMSAIDAVASAEETAMIMARLEKLAMSVCKADPRRKSDRMADALFAVVMAREFYCQCPNDPKHPCTANIRTVPTHEAVASGIDVKIILHVIADQATVDGSADSPGYLAGHGVISGDHVRDIATRPEIVARPMGNEYREVDQAEASADVAHNQDVDDPRLDDDTWLGRDRETPDLMADKHAVPNAFVPERTDAVPREADGESSAGSAMPPPRSAPQSPASADDLTPRTLYRRAPHSIPSVDVGGTPDAVEPPYVQAVPLPVVQPGDSYRPSAVADSYIRIRDCYCTWPGCDRKAWGADLDHTHEYNHDNPVAGGTTHPAHMKVLCRFHHLLKTYSDWLDDQHPDTRNGRTRLVFITPEGRTYRGPAWTGEDLFPVLARLVWDAGPVPRRHPSSLSPPFTDSRQKTRTAAKHARRQQERERNRRRSQGADELAPPPF